MNYVTQADIEQYLGVSLTGNGQNLFTLLQPTMQAMVDTYCNRSWNVTNPITETFDAYEDVLSPYPKDTFFVSYPPIKTITQVTIGGEQLDLTTVFNYKTHVKIDLAPLSGLFLTRLGHQSVAITYESDAALPAPVKLALIEWIGRKIKAAPDANKEVSLVNAGNVQVRFRDDEKGGIPDFVKLVLDQYRLPSVDRF
ncbi:MAG TPA: hypothetical protein VH186_06255 [Chloroflexia bacterium]|nr:hypothetical protein [Chloroflexia bacterium]